MPAKSYAKPVIVERRLKKMWHFEKKFSLDTVISTVGVALFVGAPIFFWGRAMESRVLRIETIIEVQAEAAKAVSSDERERRNVGQAEIKQINEKLGSLQIELAKLSVGQAAAAALAASQTQRPVSPH